MIRANQRIIQGTILTISLILSLITEKNQNSSDWISKNNS